MLFRPKNSILVSFDYEGPESFADLDDQISAIEEHYRFCKLSELVQSKKMGRAFLVFENPRKGTLLKGIPALLSRELSFTLFVDPDYVGLNRLPLMEEFVAYQKSYPEKWTPSEQLKWMERAVQDPSEVDTFLKKCRGDLGPLPIDQLDPLSFFSTWGKLVEWPVHLVEFGLSLRHNISAESLRRKIEFFEWQLKVRPVVARLVKEKVSAQEIELLERAGIRILVGHQKGEITEDTSPWDVPIWSLV